MPYSVGTVLAAGPGELRTLAVNLEGRAPTGHALLTLTATTDPSAKDRGLVPALRAALETASEPVPPNVRNAWGDWPHDLFAALAPQAERFKGLGAFVLAGPSGQCELFQVGGAIRATGYYLAQPITFPLWEAAAALEPVVTIELHRTSATTRTFEGMRLVSETPFTGPDEPRATKSGAEGQEHADRHAREMAAHFLGELARAVKPTVETARATVLIGDQPLRRALRALLPGSTAVGELDWDPDLGPRERALVAQSAADTAVGFAQAESIGRIRDGSSIVQDWQTAVVAAREGRLHEVWLNPAAALHLYLCNQCGAAVEGPEACTACSAPPYERMPVPELVVRGAQQTGTRVHFASGDALRMLEQGTGLVGRWRY